MLKEPNGDCRPIDSCQQTGQPTGIVVAGMHRSGTSALTRALNLSGAKLGSNMIRATDQNRKGYWESGHVMELNERILASCNSNWSDWAPIDSRWHAGAADFEEEAIRLLSDDFSGAPLFVFKDPRICRILDIWTNAILSIEAMPVCVLPFRDPEEVAQSLWRRDGFSYPRSLLIWLRNVLDAERQSRSMRRCFVSFDDLLSDPASTISTISETLDLPGLSVDADVAARLDGFLDPDLRHHVRDPKDGPGASPLERMARDLLDAQTLLAGNPYDPLAMERIDTLRIVLDETLNEFSGIVAAFSKSGPSVQARPSDLAAQKDAVSRLAQGFAVLPDAERQRSVLAELFPELMLAYHDSHAIEP